MSNSKIISNNLQLDHHNKYENGFQGNEHWTQAITAIHQRLSLIEALLLSRESKKTKQNVAANTEAEKIPFASHDGVEFISPVDIVQCRANGNYTGITLADGRQLLQSNTLKEIQKRLPKKIFIRVHKSHLINRHFIKKYVRTDGHYIVLESGEKIPIARLRLKNFIIKMNLDTKFDH